MSTEEQSQTQDPVELAAIRSDISNAFSAGDDSDGEDFDLDSFRARRLAEQEATAQSEPEENHTKRSQGDPFSPQFAVRRSSDAVVLEKDISSQLISPFAVAHHETSMETPSTSSSHTALMSEKYVKDENEEPASPYPHLRSSTSNEQDENLDPDIPTQSFEDISLEEDDEGAVTPTSARSPGARSPQSDGFHTPQRSDSNIGGNGVLPIPSSFSSGYPSTSAPASAPAFAAQFKKTKKTGRSALQKVISKTRPTHLPPKPQEEDAKHLKVWEDMMKKSKQAGEPNWVSMCTVLKTPFWKRRQGSKICCDVVRLTRERSKNLFLVGSRKFSQIGVAFFVNPVYANYGGEASRRNYVGNYGRKP
jgi:TBC1 domain family member 14